MPRARLALDDWLEPEGPKEIDPLKIGSLLRAERLRQAIGLRELARRIEVSPSFISQVERGRAVPSVGTLYLIVQELGLSLDGLFPGRTSNAPHAPASANASPSGLVVRADSRESIRLSSGVRWERLLNEGSSGADFILAVYEPGGESCRPDAMIRHAGKEYGFVMEGTLGVTVGFDSFELHPGDAISFESTTPHRLWTIGDEAAQAIWLVIGRGGDNRRQAQPES